MSHARWIRLFLVCVSLCGVVGAAQASRLLFSNFETQPHGNNAETPLVGDINGDGIPDLFLTQHLLGVPGRIAFGLGDGTFQPDFPSNFPDSSRQGDLLVDLNRDGRADFVELSQGGHSALKVCRSLGNGTFGPAVYYGAPPDSVGWGLLVSGDVDGDGWPDVVSYLSGHAVVWRNHGDGTLELPITTVLDMGINRVVDINGDGKIDLAGDQAQPDGSFRVAVALGLGDGTFGAPIVGVMGTLDVIGDLDGDGKVDAIGHTSDGTSGEVFFGDGTGSFVSGPLLVNPHWDGIADVDGNGRGEGVSYDASTSRSLLVSVQPDRSLDLIRSYPAPVLTSGWQGFVDLNGDGRADCVGVAEGESEYSVVLGDRNGLQSAAEYATGARPAEVALGDVNGDGRPDIVTANAAGGGISVLLGDGTGGFGPHADYAAGARPVALALRDLDGDGHLDVVVADSLGNRAEVLHGAGDGSFGAATAFPCGNGPTGIAVGDLNHDGIPDLVVVNHDSRNLAVLRGLGGGVFDVPVFQPVPDTPVKLALGDLDEDGNLDAAVLALFRLYLFRGTGGAFAPLGTYIVTTTLPYQARGVAMADMNGDGKLDVIAMVRPPNSSGLVSWFQGLGNGTLGSQTVRAAQGGFGTAIADMDGDGIPDVVAASDFFGTPTPPYSGGALFLRGHGDGTFDPWIGFGTHGVPNAVAVGDVNGDGTPDLVVANTTVSTVTVLRQSPNGPVPTLASIVSTEAFPDRVRLVWQGAPYVAATLYRLGAAGEWTIVGLVVADASGRISYVDDDVTAGESYSYRLGAGMGASEIFFGNVTVRVPLGATLALAGTLTNPTQGAWSVSFSLPGSGPARLDIVNLAGRIVASRSVGQLGGGAHVLAMPETRSLGAGIYFLKLTRGEETRLAKVIAIR